MMKAIGIWPLLVILIACSANFARADMLDFTNSKPTFGASGSETFSNLSNDNDLVIRWGEIITVGGTKLDLVAEVTGGEYKANNVEPNAGWPSGLDSRVYLNGLSGLTNENFRYGRINLRSNHAAEFTFTLVETGTNTQRAADFSFSVLDLDTGLGSTDTVDRPDPYEGMESVQLIDYDSSVVTWRTTVNTETSRTYQPATDINGNPAAWPPPFIDYYRPFFGATTPGTGSDNPDDPLNMTDQQENRTVEFDFKNTSSFTLRLALGPAGQKVDTFAEVPADEGGRNFLFTGVVAFSQPVNETTVPEPSSLAIFGLGACLAGLVYTGRRKRKVAA